MTIRFQTAFASILLHYNRTTSMNQRTYNAASPHSETFLAFPCAHMAPANLVVAFLLSPIPGGNPVHNHCLLRKHQRDSSAYAICLYFDQPQQSVQDATKEAKPQPLVIYKEPSMLGAELSSQPGWSVGVGCDKFVKAKQST
jgi:hypothetical protein